MKDKKKLKGKKKIFDGAPVENYAPTVFLLPPMLEDNTTTIWLPLFWKKMTLCNFLHPPAGKVKHYSTFRSLALEKFKHTAMWVHICSRNATLQHL